MLGVSIADPEGRGIYDAIINDGRMVVVTIR
jgi:hypothetical protein